MTGDEKKLISRLRDQGLTYQEISQETGIALSTVKMFFVRMKPSDNSGQCLLCKKALGKNAPKKKKFCSDACRSKWWRTHSERFGQSEGYKYTCLECGKDFFTYRAAKYCSRNCYYKSRRKAGAGNA